MADTQKDKNVGTALAIVEKQQDIVGNALVGASGSAVLAESTDSQSQILEQIRDIQIKTLRGIGEVAEKLKEIFNLDKIKERRERERKTELSKETGTLPAGSAGISVPNEDDGQQGEGAGGKLAALSAFMMGLPGVRTIKRLLAPIMAFFGKSGVLFKIFGRFGPLAGITLAIGFLMRYMDDIVKALAPVLDGLKSLFKELQPVFDAIMEVVDIIAKAAIISIGQSLRVLIAGIEMTFKTFMASLEFVKEVLMSIVTLDFDRLKDAFSNLFSTFNEIGEKFILAIKSAIMDTIQSVGQMFGVEDLIGTLGEMWTNVKDKFSAAIDSFFGFFGMIGDTIYNIGVSIFDFVVSIPSRIMDAVSNLFSPITNFFSSIGDRIKESINGIIDSLPLPDFVKDKMKFDTTPTPTETQLDTTGTGDAAIAEKIATDEKAGMETIAGKYQFKDGVLQNAGGDFEGSLPFAEAFVRAIGDQAKVAYDKNKKVYTVVKQDMNLGAREGTTFESPDVDMTDVVGTGSVTNVKSPASNIPDLANDNQGAVVINNNNSTVDNSKVSSNTAVNSGSLDTGIDPYHDRHAFSYP